MKIKILKLGESANVVSVPSLSPQCPMELLILCHFSYWAP